MEEEIQIRKMQATHYPKDKYLKLNYSIFDIFGPVMFIVSYNKQNNAH